MPWASVNGAELYYELHGHGPPLLLSHSGWNDARQWDPVLPALARRWQVVLYDRRGCGRSRSPTDRYTWELWRDDLRALMDRLGIEAAYVGGCSYGALLSLELALAWPERVRALILESVTPDGIPEGGGPRLVSFPARAGDLRRITAPTLVIQGEDDPHWPPPVAQRLADGIPGAELVVVPGGGHVPHLDEPALFLRAVESFLSRLEGAGGK